MTKSNTLSAKLSNSKLIKLKCGIKNGTEATLNLSFTLIGSSDDETNFPHKLLLTDTQVSKICKNFATCLSGNIKFSKTQLSKIQSGGFTYPGYYKKYPSFRITTSAECSFKKI